LALQAPDAASTRLRDELLELYTKCNRLNLRLWNEVDAPTDGLLFDRESWHDLKTHYDRACELTGMICTVEGAPIDLSADWDPAATVQESGEDSGT